MKRLLKPTYWAYSCFTISCAALLSGNGTAQADLVGRAIHTEGDIYSYYNPVDPDYDITGDMFGIRSRMDPNPPNCTVCGGLPHVIVDDSFEIHSNDHFGIIQYSDLDIFFGATDTVNGTGNDLNRAIWTFDISSVTSGLTVTIDMAAMGDFEDADQFHFDYQIDGGGFQPLFTSAVIDTNHAIQGDGQLYIMEDGHEEIVDDPLEVNAIRLINGFQTLSEPIAGIGSALELRFSAETNGSEEAFAFRNILVEGNTGGVAQDADFDKDGDVDGNDFLIWQRGFGIVGTAMNNDGDANGDSNVNGTDLGIWSTAFGTSMLPGQVSAASVPEPGTFMIGLLVGSLVFAIAYHRR
ncbi:MAG: hypothetical protein JW829_21035 [Pirellulales bacterium]|nr:hypothetical protein [Pirellulales bacterium]